MQSCIRIAFMCIQAPAAFTRIRSRVALTQLCSHMSAYDCRYIRLHTSLAAYTVIEMHFAHAAYAAPAASTCIQTNAPVCSCMQGECRSHRAQPFSLDAGVCVSLVYATRVVCRPSSNAAVCSWTLYAVLHSYRIHVHSGTSCIHTHTLTRCIRPPTHASHMHTRSAQSPSTDVCVCVRMQVLSA